ncbi:MAG: PH domain-containing protein, partial [Acidimicrobiales bacterium]
VFVLAVVALTLWLAARYARWTTTRFMVTTDRVVSRTGALSRRGREIPLERINDIAFSQSLVERLLGTGSLILESGGERGQQTFADIARPGQVQNEIYTQIERVRLVQGGRQAGGQPLSVVEQLEKLDELRNRGVLTDAEFEAQKASLFRAT